MELIVALKSRFECCWVENEGRVGTRFFGGVADYFALVLYLIKSRHYGLRFFFFFFGDA